MKSRALIVIAAVWAAACGRSAEQHLQLADAYFAGAHWPEAIIEYQSFLQSNPKRADVRLKLSDAYLRTGNGNAGLREAVRAADLMPNDAGAQLKAGRLLLEDRKYEDAKTRAHHVLADDSSNADALILLGEALAHLRDVDGAVSEFQLAIAANPARDDAYSYLGAAQIVRGDAASAEATFRKSVEMAPRSVPARIALGRYLLATGRQSEGEASLKAALAIDSSSPAANEALGAFLLASNRASEAEPYFQALANANPGPEAHFRLADYYLVTKRYDDAARVLADLAKTPQTSSEAETLLAAIDAARGNRRDALARVSLAAGANPRNVGARLLEANLLFLDGRPDEANAKAKTIVSDWPNSPTAGLAYEIIGRAAAAQDRSGEAIDAYEHAAAASSNPLAADLALARLHLATGSPDRAATYAQQATTLAPDDVGAREVLIRVLIAQKRASEAMRELSALQAAAPKAPFLANLTGELQLSEGRRDAARESFLRALAASPSDPEANAGLVRIDLDSGRTADAISRIGDSLKAPSPSSSTFLLAARAYIAVRDLSKAEAVLKRAIDAKASGLDAYGLLGQIYVNERRLEEARTEFAEMVRRNPTSISGNTMLAMLLEIQGNKSEAERIYRQVLAIDARAAVAANNLAWLLVSQGRNVDEALGFAQTANKELPDDPRVADTLGWIYCLKHIPSPAIRLLQASLDKDATDPVVHYHIGMAYAQAGDKDKARASLRQALSMQSNFQGSADARQALSALGG